MPKIPLFFKKLFSFGLQGNGKLNLHNFSSLLKKREKPVACLCLCRGWPAPGVSLLAQPSLPLAPSCLFTVPAELGGCGGLSCPPQLLCRDRCSHGHPQRQRGSEHPTNLPRCQGLPELCAHRPLAVCQLTQPPCPPSWQDRANTRGEQSLDLPTPLIALLEIVTL